MSPSANSKQDHRRCRELYYKDIARQRGDGYAFARAADDVIKLRGIVKARDDELRERQRRSDDLRASMLFVTHLLDAARLLGCIEPTATKCQRLVVNALERHAAPLPSLSPTPSSVPSVPSVVKGRET